MQAVAGVHQLPILVRQQVSAAHLGQGGEEGVVVEEQLAVSEQESSLKTLPPSSRSCTRSCVRAVYSISLWPHSVDFHIFSNRKISKKIVFFNIPTSKFLGNLGHYGKNK